MSSEALSPDPETASAAGRVSPWRPDDPRVRPLAWASERSLPVSAPFGGLFPVGLPRGASIRVVGDAAPSAVLAMLAAATGAGAWLAIVGWPDLGWGAAAELGVDLARTVAVHPVPAASWPNAMAALLDGFDLVLVASHVPSTPSVLRRLSARARERGSVLLCFHTGGAAGASAAERSWQGFGDVVVEASARGWEGLHEGAGRLLCRRVSLRVEGRRVMGRRRSSEMWLPSSLGAVEAFQAPSPVGVVPGDVPQASARGALRALTSVEAGA